MEKGFIIIHMWNIILDTQIQVNEHIKKLLYCEIGICEKYIILSC